jgi:hypothetical protein
MKRIDYFWPRLAVITSGSMFLSSALIHVVVGMPGLWIWQLYISGIALVASVLYAIVAVAINAARTLDGEDA